MAETIRDMIDDNSRVNYRMLTAYISHYALPYFVEQVKHPLLVGKDLYDGELMQNFTNSKTMRFKVANFRGPEGEAVSEEAAIPQESKDMHESITRAIYMLRKKPFSGGMPNVISIGRSSENDVVIVDYSISKRHAEIILFHGLYFLMDLGSTNGTRVNGQLVQPNVKIKLDPSANIAFGRIIFVLTGAADLYQGIRTVNALA